MIDKKFEIVKNISLSPDIFKMTLRTDKLPKIKAGQFLNLEIPNRPDMLMRRPFGIHSFSEKEGTVDIVYRVRGKGTEYLSELQAGTWVNIFLPLGNGFSILPDQKRVMVVAGGLGIAPLLPLPLTFPDKEFYTYLGFKNKADAVCVEDFQAFSRKTTVCIEEDGGGFVTQAVQNDLASVKPDVVLCCGPQALFKALKNIDFGNTPVYISLEERMACGLGACLVCACDIIKKEENRKLRVCKDGPVFLIEEVIL